ALRMAHRLPRLLAARARDAAAERQRGWLRFRQPDAGAGDRLRVPRRRDLMSGEILRRGELDQFWPGRRLRTRRPVDIAAISRLARRPCAPDDICRRGAAAHPSAGPGPRGPMTVSPIRHAAPAAAAALGLCWFLAGAWLRYYQLDLQILVEDEWHALHKILRSGFADIYQSFGRSDHSIPLALYDRWLMLHGGLTEWTMRMPMFASGIVLLAVAPLLI